MVYELKYMYDGKIQQIHYTCLVGAEALEITNLFHMVS